MKKQKESAEFLPRRSLRQRIRREGRAQMISSIDEIDDEVKHWLKVAYDLDA